VTTIEDVLPRIEAVRGLDADQVRVVQLSGGLTNVNYVVEAGRTKLVVRIPGTATELLAVDRANERHNALAAARTGVSPRILQYLDDVSVMVLEFIEGETMSARALRAPGMQARIAASLRRLHAGPRFLRDFDMFRTIDFYLRICEERDVPVPDGYHEHLREVVEVERALAARPAPTVPCHNDLLAENYIDDGRQLWIVDFEYSGNNDPCFELGDTAQECGFDQDLRARLCEAYFGEAAASLLARMNLHALMADVGWTLWAAIQARISSIEYDFWGWAVERWGRAVATFASAEFPRWLDAAARG
jgi:thiamine kinase-like enzyme